MDGSARAFVEAIDAVGLRTLPEPRRQWRVVAPVRVRDGASWAELRPAATGLGLDCEISFPAPIGRQRLKLSLSPGVFRRELAAARTFGFLQDAERLWREGLARGASLDNTLVLDHERLINPAGLRFPDEFVRHKMLDVVGDLALVGGPLIGAFRSYLGGHALNLALVRAAFAEGALVSETAPMDKPVDSSRSVAAPPPASP
jgi:UDP-3-O-[3-hydroxymyristoyl] N-acetylglucosamine deacetylase